jgi:hypothetical protein
LWRRGLLAAVVLIAAVIGLSPLLAWQKMGQQRALSLNNMRRLGNGLLLYAQDWDGCLMPPAKRLPDGAWQTWPEGLRPYVAPQSTFVNPANPVALSGKGARHPVYGYPVRTSYALNRRVWDTFAPGPFPMENLELPGQTALLVEAGPMWRDPLHPPRGPASPFALLDYGDTTDRVNGLSPYPSSHDGRMVAVAADGHGVLLKVEHYSPPDGPRDPLYGRIGDNLYNWNGGHPNGQTDRPPRE